MFVALELVGIGVFAASGALAAVRSRLDVFAALALGISTGLVGGILRDLLLGLTPPTMLRGWAYLVVPTGVALLVCRFHPAVTRLRRAVLLTDAVGLGLATTVGTVTALAAEASVVPACLIGATAGIGGGVLRDVLLREVPVVLRPGVYALAALAGAAVVALGQWWELPTLPVTLVAAALIVGMRAVVLWQSWRAPAPA